MTVPCPVPTNGHSAPTTKYDERPQARTVLTDPSLKGALPADFLYGCATASYQVEGGYDADGKGLNVWDVCLKDRENGETACDSYRLWRKDVALLQKYGCNSYRFSISWARLIPLGESAIHFVRCFGQFLERRAGGLHDLGIFTMSIEGRADVQAARMIPSIKPVLTTTTVWCVRAATFDHTSPSLPSSALS
jgi:hypothetical protein